MLSLIHHKTDDLNKNINKEVASSLNKIELFFDQKKVFYNKSKLTYVTDILSKGKASPHVFACYFDIVINIKAGDISKALQILSELNKSNIRQELEVLPYSFLSLGQDYYRFPKLVFSTFSEMPPISEPSNELFNSYKTKVFNALNIIKTIDIHIYNAINTLISQIIISTDKGEDNSFGGASSLMTWGAVFINTKRYKETPDVVESIVHELTHHILFGINSINQLVHNCPSQLFPSSLRSNLRPMDGIYHAALVCVNICFFMSKWISSPAVKNEVDKAYLYGIFTRNKKAFTKMFIIIKAEAVLSEEGSNILNMAKEKLATLDV